MHKEMETITVDFDDLVATVTLNRPSIRNAFNDTMIIELIEMFSLLREEESLRVVVLTGQGDVFCAGADMNWMRRVVDYAFDDNLKESLKLWEMLHGIYKFPKPIIGRINGSAFGGGTGLVALCDIAVAVDQAVFSFSEVKIGLVPSCISPFILKRVGEGKSREYFLTGERLSAIRAAEVGLINYAVSPEELDNRVNDLVQRLLSSGPEAVSNCKELLRTISEMSLDEAGPYTAELIAKLRVSEEGQKGMHAFLNKQKAPWIQS